jgi:hypothetical protein
VHHHFFVGIAPMFVGEVSLNAAMPFPKPIQSKIKYRPHFLTSGEMPDISRVRFKHSSIVAHAVRFWGKANMMRTFPDVCL